MSDQTEAAPAEEPAPPDHTQPREGSFEAYVLRLPYQAFGTVTQDEQQVVDWLAGYADGVAQRCTVTLGAPVRLEAPAPTLVEG